MEEEISESVSVSIGRIENGSHDWVLRNYSLHQKGPIHSEEFTACGHRWILRLFPDGVDVHNVVYSSLYLYLCDIDGDQKEVQTLLGLCLLDQSGKGNHRVAEPDKAFYLRKGTMCGKKRLIERKILESVYLKDDCLRFHCKIGVLKFQIQKLPPIKVTESNYIGADFGKLLESKEGADVVFKLGDGSSFWGHKCILFASSSPVFRSLLLDSDHHQPQEIVISDLEPTIFKAILGFMYTGTLEEDAVNYCGSSILTSFMGKVLAAAEQYELRKLKKLCESRISEKISAQSVAYWLHLADLYHATELKAACLRFVAENKEAALESEGCEYLRQSYPSLFLEFAYQKPPSSSGKGEVDFCSQVLCAVRACF